VCDCPGKRELTAPAQTELMKKKTIGKNAVICDVHEKYRAASHSATALNEMRRLIVIKIILSP